MRQRPSDIGSPAPERARLLSLLAGAAVLGAVVFIAFAILRPDAFPAWTGFPTTPAAQDIQPARTLWDWLDLLIIPAILAAAAFLLNRSEKRRDEARQERRQAEAALTAYLTEMSKLLLAPDPYSRERLKVARALSVTALAAVGSEGQRLIVRFLYESGYLTQPEQSLLRGADLSGVRLEGLDLTGANLAALDLTAANLEAADLSGANLTGAQLRSATLTRAHLTGARLADADLGGAALDSAVLFEARLSHAYLVEATLRNADLRRTRFGGADLGGVDLRGAMLTSETFFLGANVAGLLCDPDQEPYLRTTTEPLDDSTMK